MIDTDSSTVFARDEEALKLVLAFYCILESDKRSEVLSLAKRYATESRAADRHTHFPTVDPSAVRKLS
jgi:hypothetical protein